MSGLWSLFTWKWWFCGFPSSESPISWILCSSFRVNKNFLFFVVAFVLTFQGCFHVKTSVSMFVAHRSLGVLCFQGPKKWRTTGGDAEKSPLLKGLHHGSTKRDGSSPRLGVPGGGTGWAAKNQGEVVVFSFFFFREINWGVCSLPDTIFWFEKKMCICIWYITM